jgi:hypothetical protein
MAPSHEDGIPVINEAHTLLFCAFDNKPSFALVKLLKGFGEREP